VDLREFYPLELLTIKLLLCHDCEKAIIIVMIARKLLLCHDYEKAIVMYMS